MSKHIRQAGFGIVEVMLIVVVVGMMGFIGWRVYEANQTVDQTAQNTSEVTAQPVTTDGDTTAAITSVADLDTLNNDLDTIEIDDDTSAKLEADLSFE